MVPRLRRTAPYQFPVEPTHPKNATLVCAGLRRDITHRQPQSAEEHFGTELIALVDHDMRIENGESWIQAAHMFIVNHIRNAAALQQTRDHCELTHALRLSEADHRHAMHSTLLKPATHR